MKPLGMLYMVLLMAMATCTARAQDAERTTARDTRVPAVSNAAAFSVW